MAQSLFETAFLPETLMGVARVAHPKTYADIAALALFALGSAGFLLRGKAWDRPDPYHSLWFERPQEKDAASRSGVKETRDIAQKLEQANKQLVIFWGSQSGTAEGFANRLARECHLRFGLEVMAADLSDYNSKTIALIPQEKLAIFIISTFGEGDPSDNTTGLWEWINKSDASMPLLRYVAFGLGNGNYKYYNKVIDVVDAAFQRFGAQRLMDVGRADDAEGASEEDFLAWKEDLFTLFRTKLDYVERVVSYEPTLSVVEDESLEPIDLHHGEPVQKLDNSKTAATCSPVTALPIKQSYELFADSKRNCLHMELDLSSHPELHYKTGDHLAIWPSSPDSEVDRLLQALGLTDRANVPLSIKTLDSTINLRVPTPTTFAALFRYYLEICAPVSRDTVTSLAIFAPTQACKTLLQNLGKDRDSYADFLARTHITLGRLLQAAIASEPSASWQHLPFAWVIETLSPIQPRYYSISSSSIVAPRNPTITAVVSDISLPADPTTNIPGLATNYLLAHHQATSFTLSTPSDYNLDGPESALEGRKLFAHIRKSKFRLPALALQPIIMVAAGTGLAPFRGFLQERARLKQMGKNVGRMLLFFGCRNANEDYIYKDELAELQAVLSEELRIITAFSRQSDKKIYVQDRVQEESVELGALLTASDANLFICGSASMAREVGQRVIAVIKKRKAWSEEDVKAWAEVRKRSSKWQEDIWS
ncbi:hypothetical protein LTR85_001295 [Meristemomyces frigidus]|nr:hypothetical protein LTR85_001295 [Meristemomyces frigidus]